MIIGPGITIGSGIFVDSQISGGGGIVTSGLQFNLATAPSTGSTWTDSSGNGRNATLVGSPSYVSSNGGGIRLNNPDGNGTDYISVPYNIASSTVTVEVIASFNPTSFWGSIWGNEIFDISAGYVAYVDSSTNISYGIPYGETSVTITASNAIRQWIFVINGTQGSLYLNGSQVGTTGTISNQTIFATSEFYFGARHSNDGTGLTDTMNNSDSALYPVFYQMRVYNKALSGAEITQNYNAVKDTYGLEPTIVTSGLQLYLDAGNVASYPGSGTVWTDTISGKVFRLYNGGRVSQVQTDPPTYNSANGGYIQFDNSKRQWANCTTAFGDLNSYTVEGWWYLDGGNLTTSVFNLIADKFNSRYNYALGMGQMTSNKFSLYHLKAGALPKIDSTNNASTYFNTGWMHLCGTFNNSTSKMNLYINGALAATEVTISSGGTPFSGGAGISMATRNDTSSDTQYNFLNGGIAVARIYNTALTSAQVTQNYNAQRARFGL